MGLDRQLVQALDERVVVGAVGPTCEAILRVHGVKVDVIPEHPKMGPLIVTLMRHLERQAASARMATASSEAT
jgi:uroporphyrinogen-III synthase